MSYQREIRYKKNCCGRPLLTLQTDGTNAMPDLKDFYNNVPIWTIVLIKLRDFNYATGTITPPT